MDVLVITDIPRMSALFEQLGRQHAGLTVVSEIHRGIEALEQHKPAVVIIQNHLAGLSADILRKHIKSKLGRRKVRFALISSPAALDVETSEQFEVILDPSLQDEQLEQAVHKLFRPLGHPGHHEEKNQSAAGVHEAPAQELFLPGLLHQKAEADPEQTEASSAVSIGQPVPDADIEQPDQPLTYDMPRRTGISIISDFSRQLDTRADDTGAAAEPFPDREEDLGLRDFHRAPHLITDFDEPRPWYRRPAVLLVAVTLAAVVAISLYQHRAAIDLTPVNPDKLKPDSKAPVKSLPAVPVVPAVPVAPPAPAAQPAPQQQKLATHGVPRPRALPGFIPKEGHDPGYGKDHPGWEHYRGQTVEYRVFREKDTTIKAIQVIDRSGNGIQESFYTSMMKELAGVTSMRPTSSEIKEGYEIRRGVAGGLELVQYRDAGGGRMRGFVATWP